MKQVTDKSEEYKRVQTVYEQFDEWVNGFICKDAAAWYPCDNARLKVGEMYVVRRNDGIAPSPLSVQVWTQSGWLPVFGLVDKLSPTDEEVLEILSAEPLEYAER